MKLRHMLFGAPAPSDPQPGNFHHSSVLADIVLATQLQQGGSASTSLAVPAIYRGTQLIADSMAGFPWYTFDGGPNDGSRQVRLPSRQEELPTLLVNPDPLALSRDQWIRDVINSLMWRGNAYLLGSMYVEGHPTRVQVLNPDQVVVKWADEARTFRDYSWGVDQPLPRSQVRHLALNLTPGALKGIGPVQSLYEIITNQRKADAWVAGLWEDGVPSGKLIHPGKLNTDEATALAQQWADSRATSGTGVLSGGMDYQVLSFSADQLQALQSRSFNVAEMARALGIPAHLLNAATGVAGASSSSMTYTNVRDIWLEFLALTLRPVYGDRIAEAMSSFLPRGTSVAFDYSEFMRADEKERYDSAKVALDAGFLTVDEVRAKEGLAPSPELEAEKVRKQRLGEQIAGATGDDDREVEDERAADPQSAGS